MFLGWLEGTFGWEVLLLSYSIVTALEMDTAYEWVTLDAFTSTAPLARTAVPLPYVPGAEKSNHRHSGVGANTLPAEKRVLPLKGRIRVFP